MNMFVSQQSELMKNHLPGSSLPAFEIVFGTTDDKGFPLLFGFDRVDSKFVVIVRSVQSTTGWEMVDLGAQFTIGADIVACDVAQKPDGTIRVAIFLPVSDKLNTLIAPVQRPIIRLPQYNVMYLDMSLSSNPASVRYPGVFKSAPKLLSMVTSTPT